MTANGVGTCGADDNQAQAGHLIPWGGAFHMTQDPISSENHTPVLSANASIGVMVTPLAIRGRRGGAELEMGNHEDPAFAVRATKVSTVAETKQGQETIVRRLTEIECERLQGYPDGWTEGQSASARYRQLGNSVAVPCVEWIARRLISEDERLK